MHPVRRGTIGIVNDIGAQMKVREGGMLEDHCSMLG